ncbi:Bug family tripartite tricarboxylate transporter substrate binding protein [Parapusillimonas sp. JC17]|uniref:Bug family tripartite tricarboxylate transporter substrate binding protein n=1 Tax=Parapusillimonas sp. JC17 TaxID=3445768 RepID=UPI003F9F2C2C
MKFKHILFAGLTAALINGGAAHASADSYPKEPVRLISPFAAGGTNDILARLSARVLSEKLGGQFVVEQRTGAGGMIGSNAVAKSAPDGNTLLMGSISTHAVAPYVFANPPFDARKDFTPITVVASVPLVLVVNKNSPYKTLDDVLKAARQDPTSLTYGSPGNGAVPHLASELLASIANVKFTHVPYRGEANALTDLLGGQIDMVFANLPAALAHLKGGTLRPLVVSSTQRASALPDVPTAAEAGIANFEVDAWYALLGPAGMPKDVVDKLAAAIQASVKQPEIIEVIHAQGAEPVGNSAAEFAAYLSAEQSKWAEAVKKAGIEPM